MENEQIVIELKELLYMEFRRYLYRRKANVTAQSILLAIGYNINKGTARNLRATPRAFYQSDVIIIIQWLYISDHWKLVLLLSSEQTVSGYRVCIHL